MTRWISLALGLAMAGVCRAQDVPLQPERWDSTTISFGIGSTILPTPVSATEKLGDGGGGIIGGNVTLNLKASREIVPNWRIPLSVSLAFLRGSEQFWHRDVVQPGDTVVSPRLLSNSSNVITIAAGLEYIERYPLVSPYGGVDVSFSSIGVTSYDYTSGSENLLHQTLPSMSRFGVTLRAGAEFPLFDAFYYDVSAELGAMNLLGRPSDSVYTNSQLLTPTQHGRDEYASRYAEGKSGEAIVTYFRLLVKLAWKF